MCHFQKQEGSRALLFSNATKGFQNKKPEYSDFPPFHVAHLDAGVPLASSGSAVCSRTAWSRSWGPTSIFTAHCFKWLILLFGLRKGLPQIGHSGIRGVEGVSAFSASSKHLEEDSQHRRTLSPVTCVHVRMERPWAQACSPGASSSTQLAIGLQSLNFASASEAG